ncbi:MAG: porin [Rhizobiaceae bacterium]
MNIKTFLLGSAAALVAVSGARAADAVVAADPEPAEYVRVCDAYGAGYFYIPGTETCIKLSGHVRYEILYGAPYGAGTTGFDKEAKGRLEITTKNESDLGTVTGWIRYDFRQNSFWGQYSSNQFSLGVGGLEMGFQDSSMNRFFGYGGFTDYGSIHGYGYETRHYISYTYTGEAMSAIISLDHDNALNFVPDVMVGAKGTFGKVSVGAGIGFDTSASAQTFRAQIGAALNDKVNVQLIGLYNNGASQYWGFYAGGSYSLIGSVSAKLTDKVSVALDVDYVHNAASTNEWGVVADVSYQIAPGLAALLEITNSGNFGAATRTTGGMLRFERSF